MLFLARRRSAFLRCHFWRAAVATFCDAIFCALHARLFVMLFFVRRRSDCLRCHFWRAAGATFCGAIFCAPQGRLFVMLFFALRRFGFFDDIFVARRSRDFSWCYFLCIALPHVRLFLMLPNIQEYSRPHQDQFSRPHQDQFSRGNTCKKWSARNPSTGLEQPTKDPTRTKIPTPLGPNPPTTLEVPSKEGQRTNFSRANILTQ